MYLAALAGLFRRLSTYFALKPEGVGGGGVSFRNNRNNRNKKTKQTKKPTIKTASPMLSAPPAFWNMLCEELGLVYGLGSTGIVRT